MTTLSAITNKVQRNERLSFDDGVELFRSNDLITIGRLANHTRERLNGKLSWWWGRDLRGAAAATDCRTQNFRSPLAGSRRGRASDGRTVECDDALRSRRDSGRTGRPSREATRAARCDRRVQLFYSVG